MLALVTFSTVARRPYFYRVVSVSVDQNGITHTHARLTFNPLVTPILWHLFPRQIPGAPMTRHQRDLIRRRVRLLLTALGDTPETIRTTLHRLHTFGESSPEPDRRTPLEHYLYVRTGQTFDLGLRLITVNDTFDVATPKSIQRYLRSPHNTPLF